MDCMLCGCCSYVCPSNIPLSRSSRCVEERARARSRRRRRHERRGAPAPRWLLTASPHVKGSPRLHAAHHVDGGREPGADLRRRRVLLRPQRAARPDRRPPPGAVLTERVFGKRGAARRRLRRDHGPPARPDATARDSPLDGLRGRCVRPGLREVDLRRPRAESLQPRAPRPRVPAGRVPRRDHVAADGRA